MQVTIQPGTLRGEVAAIASKSHAHRLLICAALSREPSRVVCTETSEDIEATADCLRGMGAAISREAQSYLVRPIVPGRTGVRDLPCRESGSTLRFLLPVACALGGQSRFFAQGRLPERPLSPLYEQLLAHGCRLGPQGETPFWCEGPLESGDYVLPGNVSSQFVSGLLFALPLLLGDSTLRLTGEVESRPYIDLTLQALHEAGIRVEQQGQEFRIPGGQQYRAPAECRAEGDWSNAAFWLCAGALGAQGVTCTNLRQDSLQGDRAVANLLCRFGAEVTAKSDSVSVRGGRLSGIEIDAGNIPDLVPVLAVVACAARGDTRISHAERLRIKESDRLQSVYEVLSALGADMELRPDGFCIHGHGGLTGGRVRAHGDHRIAMMAAVAASICRESVTVEGAEAVRKSYPGFFSDMKTLGARLCVREA